MSRASRFVEMRIVDGIEIPMPVAGKPATAKTTRAYAGAALAFPYSPKRLKLEDVYLPDGKVKQEERYYKCDLGCTYLKRRFCPTHGEVLPEELHFIGLCCGDVMYARRAQKAAEGDLDSQIYLTDRIEGKPKQAIDANISTFSYNDVLNMLIEDEAQNPTKAPKITVDPFSYKDNPNNNMNTVHLNPFADAEDVQVIDAPEKPKTLLERI